MPPSAATSPLIDRYGRRIDYVRLSITDRCDLRCRYCMQANTRFLPRHQLLTLEEMARLAQCFVELGVTRMRVTGGEPLIRRNALWLFEQLGALPGLRELTLTTNGTQLPRYARALKDAGVRRVNISLDSLRPERFKDLTRIGDLSKTLAGIDAAQQAGFERIKLNSVILDEQHLDEVIELARFALERGLDISFIEEMPLGDIADRDRSHAYCSSDAIRRQLETVFTLLPTTETTGGPSRYLRVAGYDNRIGLIAPHSHNFCADCNRVRVTAEGRLVLCLGQEYSVDLLRVLRAHPTDSERIKHAICASLDHKPRGHDFALAGVPVIQRYMNLTGG